MRLAIAVLLLAGCAVGQNSTVCAKKHLAEKGLTDVEDCIVMPEIPLPNFVLVGKIGEGPKGLNFLDTRPGDCYRVNQDGTLEKVDECYSKSELVTWDSIRSGTNTRQGDESYPVDVAAVQINSITGKRVGCLDTSRILLTAEDGKHWCHQPQP